MMHYFVINGDFEPDVYEGWLVPLPSMEDFILTDQPFPFVQLEIVSGSTPPDMFPLSNVVSKRFVDTLERCQATGYMAHPVRAVKDGKPVGEYFVLKVLGRGGPLDPVRSHVVVHGSGSGAFSSWDGTFMDESKWDGSDIFAIPGMGIHTFVVERIADALREDKLINLRIVRNDEHSLLGKGTRRRGRLRRDR